MCHNNPRMTVDYNSITLLYIKESTSENSNLINTLQNTFKGRYDLGNMRCFGEYEWKKFWIGKECYLSRNCIVLLFNFNSLAMQKWWQKYVEKPIKELL